MWLRFPGTSRCSLSSNQCQSSHLASFALSLALPSVSLTWPPGIAQSAVTNTPRSAPWRSCKAKSAFAGSGSAIASRRYFPARSCNVLRIATPALPPALPSVASLGLEPVDEIDHIVDPATGAEANTLLAMAMARCVLPVPVPLTNTALRCCAMKPPARSLTSRVHSNWNPSRSLASGSLAMVNWYLIERACFSFISTEKARPGPFYSQHDFVSSSPAADDRKQLRG